jgi:hypothetical protein
MDIEATALSKRVACSRGSNAGEEARETVGDAEALFGKLK